MECKSIIFIIASIAVPILGWLFLRLIGWTIRKLIDLE